jgi:UDP-3-O-acyl N-acetylglucosamine deacetylase
MERQRTIKAQAAISGIGLQTGKPVRLKIKPAPADSGVTFIRTDLPGSPKVKIDPSNLRESKKTLQRTIIKDGRAEVHTTEHLLAALNALYIDNLDIEIDSAELPGLDGSAKEYARTIKEAGFEEQDAERRYIRIEKPIIVSNGDSSIQIIPDDDCRIEYFLDYDHPMLREQWFDVRLKPSNVSMGFFEREIAPSRTFCLMKEALKLRFIRGLGLGVKLLAPDNVLVIGSGGPVNNEFRFPDEPVRHKVLDMLGDIFVLGLRVKGRITARKSGHKLNNAFIKRLAEERSAV